VGWQWLYLDLLFTTLLATGKDAERIVLGTQVTGKPYGELANGWENCELEPSNFRQSPEAVLIYFQ